MLGKLLTFLLNIKDFMTQVVFNRLVTMTVLIYKYIYIYVDLYINYIYICNTIM